MLILWRNFSAEGEIFYEIDGTNGIDGIDEMNGIDEKFASSFSVTHQAKRYPSLPSSVSAPIYPSPCPPKSARNKFIVRRG